MKPVLKWVGGKTQLLDHIRERIPSDIGTYYEPFVGGAAVLLNLAPQNAVVGDVNKELINLYQVIKDAPEALIKSLRKHQNTPEYFYTMRAKDRNRRSYSQLSPVTKASRIIFLNKTCYNGLFRVNSRGELNAPFGYYKNPRICDETNIREVSAYFNANNLTFLNADFESVVETAQAGDFVYFDPPYDPVSLSASFTGYSAGGFGRADQVRLKECCDRLHQKGVRFLLSNSATDFIKDLYKEYTIDIVPAKRAINCKGDSRQEVPEVLVRNYDC